MEIKPRYFNIPFPIELFKKDKINIGSKKQRDYLIKRNIYYYIYGHKKNVIIQQRCETFFSLSNEVKNYLEKNYRSINILNISVFGSALHSLNNEDYDFLVIVQGNLFDNLKTKIKLNKKEYNIGISIKGEENLSKGIIDKKSKFDKENQIKIINRTSISLPYRHLAIQGFDFKENKNIFLSNCYAQIYDLLINTYNSYCLKGINKIKDKTRARKILSRVFEATKYALLINKTKRLENIQRKIFIEKSKSYQLKKSKKIFLDFVKYYNNLVK